MATLLLLRSPASTGLRDTRQRQDHSPGGRVQAERLLCPSWEGDILSPLFCSELEQVELVVLYYFKTFSAFKELGPLLVEVDFER